MSIVLKSYLISLQRLTNIATPGGNLWLVILLSGMLLFANLHRGDLGGYDDAVYAAQARQVLKTGEWGTLRLNGSPDFDKPPLFVWIVAAFFRIFGTSDSVAKLPVAVFGFLTILLTGELARQWSKNGWLAILSMIVMMTTQYFVKYSTHVMHAVPLTFFFTLSIYLYLRYLAGGCNRRLLLLAGVSCGLAALTVSPVGFFPVVIIISDMLLKRQFERLRSRDTLFLLSGTLAIPLLWYLWELHLFGMDFLRGHFANIAAHALAVEERSLAAKTWGYLQYLLLLLRHYWPWLPFMLVGLVDALCRLSFSRENGFEGRSNLLCIWLVIVIIPFSLAESKVLRYIMPVFPLFSILAATSLEKFVTIHQRRRTTIAWIVLGAIIIGATLFPTIRWRAEDTRQLAPVIARLTPPERRIILYTAGEWQWEHRNTLIWYAERFVDHDLSLESVFSKLQAEREALAVIDRVSLERSWLLSTGRLEIVTQTSRFVLARATVP